MISDRRKEKWLRRKTAIRKRVIGTPERPRMTVFKSTNHTYVQVVDDSQGKTLVAASTLEKDHRQDLEKLKKMDAAVRIGEIIAARCLAQHIDKVVFDRNGYPYHGRVAKLADAARAKGLKF
jgi:large subunit ribosomal protein L18